MCRMVDMYVACAKSEDYQGEAGENQNVQGERCTGNFGVVRGRTG